MNEILGILEEMEIFEKEQKRNSRTEKYNV